jgi:hypothetical protein
LPEEHGHSQECQQEKLFRHGLSIPPYNRVDGSHAMGTDTGDLSPMFPRGSCPMRRKGNRTRMRLHVQAQKEESAEEA